MLVVHVDKNNQLSLELYSRLVLTVVVAIRNFLRWSRDNVIPISRRGGCQRSVVLSLRLCPPLPAHRVLRSVVEAWHKAATMLFHISAFSVFVLAAFGTLLSTEPAWQTVLTSQACITTANAC